MSAAREKLIEAVVSPLAGDDELQLIGRQQVGELIAPAVDESCLDEVTGRLVGPRPKLWRWLGLAVVLVVSLPMIYWALLKGGSGAIGGFRNMDRLVHGEIPDDRIEWPFALAGSLHQRFGIGPRNPESGSSGGEALEKSTAVERVHGRNWFAGKAYSPIHLRRISTAAA